MNPQKHNLTVLAQIARWIPDRIVENLARKHKIQARSFSADSHVMAMLYAHLAHSLSLNDICGSLRNHAGPLSQIRNCTPPSRNGLSHANKTRNAEWPRSCSGGSMEPLQNSTRSFSRRAGIIQGFRTGFANAPSGRSIPRPSS